MTSKTHLYAEAPPPPSTSDSPLIRVQENRGRLKATPEALSGPRSRDRWAT